MLNNKKYGHWALVTGAARGLGAEFTRQLACNGFNIVMVDIDADALESTKKQIQAQYPADLFCIAQDLSKSNFLNELIPRISHIEIGLLINNAGFSNIGRFLEKDPVELETQLMVNTRALLLLTRYFAEKMAMRGGGGIINVSSGGAQLPSAYNSTYVGGKSYALTFSESLWWELKEKNIDVLGFMPVLTDTPGLAKQQFTSSSQLMSTQECVAQAFQYLGKRPSVLAGFRHRLLHNLLLTLIPKRWRIRLVSNQIRTMFGTIE